MLSLLAVALVAAGFVALLLVTRQSDDTTSDTAADGSTSTAAPTGAEAPVGGVAASTSYAPYTVEADPTEVATDAPRTTRSGEVEVVLTFAGYDRASRSVEANGFVADVIQEGGTCTLTLTKGSDTVTATSTAVADATTTSCGLLQTTTDLDAGTWEAELSYRSPDAEGTSDVLEVTVR